MAGLLKWAVADCCLLSLLLDGCRSKVITKHIGLSCFQTLLPTNAAFFNANQNQASIKLTPTASIGINTDTPGLLFLLPGTHPFSLLWFIRIVLHHTVDVSCWFVQSFIPPLLLLLAVVIRSIGRSIFNRSLDLHGAYEFMPLYICPSIVVGRLSCCCSCSCSSSTVGLLRVSFTLYNLLESYGSSCSSIILTKQSSNSNSLLRSLLG
jgi:hypothetical protein